MAEANAVGATVCTIATAVYYRMQESTGARADTLRSADWLVTCPLML